MTLPVEPPVRPMLAKAAKEWPEGDFLYEPKWDGFRCIVFKDGDRIELGSRNEKPLSRYFPELIEPLQAQLPHRCVLDGELVIPTSDGLDFDLLSQRIHPAESRVQKLALATPANLVVFDILAIDDRDLRAEPLRERRAVLQSALGALTAPLHLTPASTDVELAKDWFARFEGSGFDGVMAKSLDGEYVEDKRVQLKLKHHRTADCVVAGYRHHKDGGVGSLLLGLFDDGTESGGAAEPGRPDGAASDRSGGTEGSGQPRLHHVGVCSAFAASRRRTLAAELSDYESDAIEGHPWGEWAQAQAHDGTVRMPGAPSRWSNGKSHAWVPLRCELVAEVTYENFTNGRFRHPARFVRWRPDKSPEQCTYDQVDQPPPLEFGEIFRTVD